MNNSCLREECGLFGIYFNHPSFKENIVGGQRLRVERFNGKIEDLKGKLIDSLNRYNFEVKLKQLDYKTPADYLKIKHNYSVQRIVI